MPHPPDRVGSARVWGTSSGTDSIAPGEVRLTGSVYSSRIARKRMSGQRSSVRLKLTRVGAR